MAKILYYTSNVSKGMNLENYEEFENSTFKVLGTSVKVMNADGEWKKVKSIDGLKGYTATKDGFYSVI